MKETFQNITWRALCELGDYFSRLGGAGRPMGFIESDIPAYIVCKVLLRFDDSVDLETYISSDLSYPQREDISILTAKVDNILLEIPYEDFSFSYIKEFWNYYDKKLKAIDKSKEWKKLEEEIDNLITKNSKL